MPTETNTQTPNTPDVHENENGDLTPNGSNDGPKAAEKTAEQLGNDDGDTTGNELANDLDAQPEHLDDGEGDGPKAAEKTAKAIAKANKGNEDEVEPNAVRQIIGKYQGRTATRRLARHERAAAQADDNTEDKN